MKTPEELAKYAKEVQKALIGTSWREKDIVLTYLLNVAKKKQNEEANAALGVGQPKQFEE